MRRICAHSRGCSRKMSVVVIGIATSSIVVQLAFGLHGDVALMYLVRQVSSRVRTARLLTHDVHDGVVDVCQPVFIASGQLTLTFQ